MKTAPSPYDFLERPASLARGNVTADVTNALRDAIVSLALRPGEMLDKNAICDQLGVSRFPVSEALARLQGEGLIEILPQRGSIVSLVRIADVREYMLIRKALESEAVRALVGRHDDSLIADLRANLAGQRHAVERDDRSGFHARDLEFHDMLLDAMRFAKVRAIIDSVRANLDRARRLIITPRRLALSLDEHRAVFDAIVAGQTERAIAAMRGHIDSVMAELLVFARQRPDIFADGNDMEAEEDTFPFG